jgi:hypothetical protein
VAQGCSRQLAAMPATLIVPRATPPTTSIGETSSPVAGVAACACAGRNVPSAMVKIAVKRAIRMPSVWGHRAEPSAADGGLRVGI